jgi:WD40 repeat protein
VRDVGPYKALEELGAGGAAIVLRAVAPDGREVAVKVLRAGAAAGAVERFTREARLLASLGEGFVPLLDVGTSSAGVYLVMPLLRGGTLRDRLRRGPLAIEAAVSLTIELARALGRAHRAGVVHRDVKPENVLFDEAGRAWLADLGVALHLGAPPQARLSRTGELRGTVGYMAPEQVEDARRVGPPADVFALGAILYEALAGRPAFDGASDLEVLARMADGQREALRAARPDAPAWLVDVVDAALAQDPAARPADGEALARALTRAKVLAERRPRRSRSAPALVLGLALALALVVALRTLVVAPSIPGPPPLVATTTTSEAPPAPPPLPATVSPATRLERVATWGGGQLRHPGVRDVAFVDEPPLAASCGDDGTVRLWHVDRRTEVARLEAGPGPGFTTLAASPDGAWIAAARADGRLVVWERATGRVAATLEGHAGEVTRLTFGSPANRLFSISLDATARYWDVSAAAPALRTLAFDGPLRAFAMGAGVLALAGSDSSGVVKVLDRAGAAGTRSYTPRSSAVRDLVVRPDGKLAVSAHADGWLAVWNPVGGEVLAATTLPGGASQRLFWSADGVSVVTLSETGTLEVLDVAGGLTIERRIVTRLAWRAMALARSGHVAMLVGDGGRLTLWNLDTGDELWQRAGHMGPVTAVTFVAPGQVLSGGADGCRLLWNAETGELLDALERAEAPITAAAGRFAAAGDGVWITAEPWRGPGTHMTPTAGAQVHSVTASSGGRFLLTADEQGTAAVWDVQAQRPGADWKNLHSLRVNGVETRAATLVERPDGLFVAFGAGSGEVRLVRADDVSVETALLGHQAAVAALALHGQRLLSADVAGAVFVWDLDSRAAALQVDAGAPVRALASSPDARLFATVDDAGALRLWDGATGVALAALEDAHATCVAFDPFDPSGPGAASLVAGAADGTVLRLAVRRAP